MVIKHFLLKNLQALGSFLALCLSCFGSAKLSYLEKPFALYHPLALVCALLHPRRGWGLTPTTITDSSRANDLAPLPELEIPSG